LCSPDGAFLEANELRLSRPHWIRIASTSSLVQLDVRTGARHIATGLASSSGATLFTSTTFVVAASAVAAATTALTTNTVLLSAA
jgi:hypothetical protein